MLGESVSGLYAYHAAKQITEDDFKAVNELAYEARERIAPARAKFGTEKIGF